MSENNVNITGLNFKYGEYKNLENVNVSNGTIYVTVDEQAMYVDLNDKRIRIGQTISLTNSEWEALKPPYSQDAFYYLTDANALLKYTGTQWVQINSTQDIKNLLGFLGVVSALPSTASAGQICTYSNMNYIYTGSKWESIGTIGSEFLLITTDVEELKTKSATHTAQINTLNELTDIQNKLINKTINYVGEFDSLPSADSYNAYDVCVNKADGKAYYIKADKDTKQWVNTSNIIAELKNYIDLVAAAAGDKGAVEELQSNLETLKTNLNSLTVGATSLKNFKQVEDKISTIESTYATKDELDDTKSAITGDTSSTIKDVEDKLDLASKSISTNTQNIATMVNGATITTFKGIEDKIDNAISTVGQNYATKTELQTATNTLNESIGKVSTDLGTLSQNFTSFKQTADALKYQGTISAITDLPTTNVQIGWTYKVVSEFAKTNIIVSQTDDLNVYIGDLLVATGTEDNAGNIISDTLKWDHIPSGYYADYVPELNMVQSNNPNQVEISLTSSHAAENVTGDLGNFYISSNSESINIQANSNNVLIGMVWGQF